MKLAVEKNLPVKVIKFLLRKGADPHIKDKNGIDACPYGILRYPKIECF